MKLIYAGKGIEITGSLEDRLEKKLSKLERYFRDDVEAHIRLEQQKGARNICEITIAVNSLILRAEEVSQDMYQSIDGAVDKLNRQIRRYRTKLEKRLRSGAFEPVADEIPEAEVAPADYSVVRTKRFGVKPMSAEDAIAQMELLGHNFFIFKKEDDDQLCVLYRRNDDTYGLLIPED